MGFSLADKFVKRAGMDYWDKLQLTVVDSIEEALHDVPEDQIFCLSTKGSASYTEFSLPSSGTYVFGSESKGLPKEILKKYYKNCLRIPMQQDIRSLNLATSVGIVLYEVVRQKTVALQKNPTV
ncbi:tRNA (cytidine(34)-2'-O)-methyltransferase [Chlamydia pneumoniae B21]|nr:tRNA (cytidine(34)-2'-O)-methyltransferase [Chlamydia pneumoniae B21]